MKSRLLIADSNATLRELRRRLFVGCGFDVFTADSAVDCYRLLVHLVPDVLLMDWNLLWGGADGVLALLAESCRTPLVPVVLTGDAAALAASEDQYKLIVTARHPSPVRVADLLNSVWAASKRIDSQPAAGLRHA